MDSDPLETLDAKDRQWLAEQAEERERISKRNVLQGALTFLGGAGLAAGGSYALGNVAAQPSTSDGDGDLGSSSQRIDVWADGMDVLELLNAVYGEAVNGLGTVSGTTDIDLNSGNMATATLGGDTTFTFSNAISSGSYDGNALFVKVKQDANTQYAITWPSSVTWVDPGGKPSDPATGNELEVGLQSYDGGNSWYGGEVGRY